MISVCIATYNGEKYIKSQLDSVLSQIEECDEVIISDDSSTDATINIVTSIQDSRIKIYINEREKRKMPSINLITTNFENALFHATGDIIFLADQDDIWLPNKVEVMLQYLQKYDYVVSDCYITDADLDIKCDTRFYDGSGFTKNRWKALIAPTPYQGSCAAFRRSVLNKALPFPKGIQSHDRWIGYIASFFFSYKIISESLILYRRHGENASTTTECSRNSTFYKVMTRIKYIVELLKLKFKK